MLQTECPGQSVCVSVCCMSVCLLVTFVSSAKTAEPIETPFGGADLGGPKEPCITYADPKKRRGNVRGCPAYSKVLTISAAAFAATRTIAWIGHARASSIIKMPCNCKQPQTLFDNSMPGCWLFPAPVKSYYTDLIVNKHDVVKYGNANLLKENLPMYRARYILRYGRRRRSTAIERVRTRGGLKNLTLKACYGRRAQL